MFKLLDKEQISEYVNSIEGPLEKFFFTEKQKSEVEAQRKKLEATKNYLRSLGSNPNLTDQYEVDIMGGKIYANSEALNVYRRLQALEKNGTRYDLKKSFLSLTGQAVIMSEFCARELGLISDSYLTGDEVLDLLDILDEEGIEKTKVDKVEEAAEKYGAILVQRGGYIQLKPLLEESINEKISIDTSYQQQSSDPKKSAQSNQDSEHGASLDTLMHRVVDEKPTIPIAPAPINLNQIKQQVTARELPVGAPIPPPGKDRSGKSNKSDSMMAPPLAKPPVPLPPTMPTMVAPPIAEPKYKASDQPTLGLNSLKDIQTVDDLKKIEAAHLRQGYLPEQIKFIRSKISYLAAANRLLPIQVVNIFEQGPLFKLYLQMGSEIIGTSGNDYKQVMAKIAAAGSEVLSFQEFEAMADLRKDLERM